MQELAYKLKIKQMLKSMCMMFQLFGISLCKQVCNVLDKEQVASNLVEVLFGNVLMSIQNCYLVTF